MIEAILRTAGWHARSAQPDKRRIVAVALAVGAVAPAPADAQIVNVQGALAKPPKEDGVTGQVELKIDWREGNNRLLDLGAAGSVIVRRGRLLALAIARGELATGAGTTFKQRTFEHVRARVRLDEHWKWEVFAQHELDRFRRLTVRALSGTGPAFQIVSSDAVSVLAGVSYMFEYEQLDDREATNDAGDRYLNHRASAYLTGQEKLGDTVAVTQTVYVQPRIDDPRDVRLLGELALTSKLSRHFALTDGLTVAYDHTPPAGIERTDLQLRIALLITF